MHTDDDKSLQAQAEIMAGSLVDSVPDEAIQDVVDQAIGAEGPFRDKLETCFNSGVFTGAKMALMMSLHQEQETLGILKSTIEACDAAIQQVDNADFMMAISTIRSPLALFFQEQDRRFQEAFSAQMGTVFNIPSELIRGNRPTAEIPRDVVVQIGALNSTEHGALFFAYLTQNRRTDLKCHCPGHLMTAFHEQTFDIDAIRRSLDEQFPNPEDGMYAFGRYLIDFCRQQFAKNAQSHFDVSSVSETEAGKMAQDFLTNLKLKPGDSL